MMMQSFAINDSDYFVPEVWKLVEHHHFYFQKALFITFYAQSMDYVLFLRFIRCFFIRSMAAFLFGCLTLVSVQKGLCLLNRVAICY